MLNRAQIQILPAHLGSNNKEIMRRNSMSTKKRFQIMNRFYLVLGLLCGFTAQTFAQSDEPLSDFILPGITEFTAPSNFGTENQPTRKIWFEAVLLDEGAPIETGLQWRAFDPTPDASGKFTLVAAAEGGSTDLELPPGEYFVHVAFGRAGVTKKLLIESVGEIPTQRFVLDAGGIVLNAVTGTNGWISPANLRFAIYSGEDTVIQDSERQMVLENVKPNMIVRLNEGTYHVVSSYGDTNAVSRADITVTKGKLTEVQMQHRAAQVTLKLVSKEGGEGIADTSWAIYSSSGDIIKEMVGAFPSLILTEGDYTAIASHKGKDHSKEFHVTPGRNSDIEVLLPLTQ